jgi:NADPH-dependent 2,4-dienoyl-CoA reductase/sulfur reductase-like enzyme
MTAPAISLRIDGRPIVAAPGTTVAAALWSAGVWRFRTSLSGEPRGPVCGMGICFECRVTIDGVPHCRACLVPCAPGMTIETASDPLPAAAIALRAPAGSTASTLQADVAVVGAGPAGIAAASRAAEAGASVLLLDEAPAPGGQIWRRPAAGAAPGRLARRWLDRLAASGARRLDGATVLDVLPGTSAGPASAGSVLAGGGAGSSLGPGGVGSVLGPGRAGVVLGLGGSPGSATARDARSRSAGDGGSGSCPGWTLLVEREGRALCVEARRLIIATGARERFIPFPGWTLPNVVGAGGAQALLKSGASLRGRRVVVAGSGPLLLPVAAALSRAGAAIALVAEQAPAAAVARFAATLWHRPRLLAQAARYRAAFWPARYRCGVWVSAAHGDDAGLAVREATVTDGRRSWREECDLLACAYGLVPNLELARLLGCELTGGGGRQVVRVDELQQTSVPGVYCAGEPTGVGGLELALVTGEVAGLAAAATPAAVRELADLRALSRRRAATRRHLAALDRAFQPRPRLRQLAAPDTLVCRCEDVPLRRLDPAWGPRQAKLYTRAGMGPCQGRVCGPALAMLLGWEELDTVRGPLEPAALSTLAELGAAGHLAAPAAAVAAVATAAASPAAAGPGDLPAFIQHPDQGD